MRVFLTASRHRCHEFHLRNIAVLSLTHNLIYVKSVSCDFPGEQWTDARQIQAVALSIVASKSFASRRLRLSQASSTTQRPR